ncbi:hypothetical protein ACOME3_007759 [Neoechinorhynchus agilis]
MQSNNVLSRLRSATSSSRQRHSDAFAHLHKEGARSWHHSHASGFHRAFHNALTSLRHGTNTARSRIFAQIVFPFIHLVQMSPPPSTTDQTGTTIIRRTAVEHGFRRAGATEPSPASLNVIREQRDHEKQELARLNDRFAAYIQRVKYLENQNKKLQSELDELRSGYSLDTERLRREYEPALSDIRDKLDLVTSEKAKCEIRAKRAAYDAQTYRQLTDDVQQWINGDRVKVEHLERTLRDNDVELECLRSQLRDMDNERQRQRTELNRLTDQLTVLLRELDAETVQRVQVENEKQTLEEQIPFLNALHEEEIAELRSLQTGAYLDPSAFYRSELQRAIKEIRSDFAQLSQAQRTELEEYYRIKTDEVRRQEQERVELQQKAAAAGDANAQDVHQLRTSITQSKTEINELQQECGHLTGILSSLEGDLEEVRRTNLIAVAMQSFIGGNSYQDFNTFAIILI